MKKAKKHAKKHSSKGFSLVELLIVVAIILIIAAIAIPNLLRSRIAANEASAVASVRTLNTAEVSYMSSYPTNDAGAVGGFGSMADLGQGSSASCNSPTSSGACLVDSALVAAVDTTHLKSGYFFTITLPSVGDYVISANPGTPGTTGVRAFCSLPDGVVRYLQAGTTTAVSTDNGCTAYTPL